MKYRLIDTPGFPVKHVSELKEGDGDVLYVLRDGKPVFSDELTEWQTAMDTNLNPTGLVARAFEVVQDEWTWEVFRSPISGIRYCVVRRNGAYACQFDSEQAAAEYCAWKNGGGV